MGRLLRLLALAAGAVWLVRRLGGGAQHMEQVSIGYTDGLSTVLDVGSPERELLVASAADAL